MMANAWPDAAALRASLARAERRARWIAIAESSAAGLAAALPTTLVLWLARAPTLVTAVCGLAAAVVAAVIVFVRRRPRSIAAAIEMRAPECRNILITAAELLDRPTRVRPHIGEAVCREATHTIDTLDIPALLPARRAIVSLLTLTMTWVLALVLVATRPDVIAAARLAPAVSQRGVVDGVTVTVVSPAYTRRASITLRDPSRLEALAGSRILLRVMADAAAVNIETVQGTRSLAAGDEFTGEVVADADDYIAITAISSNGTPGAQRLIGVTVTPDHPARVRVTTPGRDMFLPDANRVVAVAIDADDDLGLSSLHLRYTKVSGSGEQFTFTDGDVPVQVTRTTERAWQARATLSLASLGLGAGDMVVYRGVAADSRPGAPPSESDAFIIEITAPGGVAAEGFAIADEEDRYGLSQQMIIQETERLIARTSSMAPADVTTAALTLAAAQRSVRAEFVFMMGGELAEEVVAAASMDDLHEEAHAEADEDAARLANQGRAALLQAIRSMSRANAALTNGELTDALAAEKAALASLQRAFSRTRYILRALTQRERVDLSRRNTGDLTNAARDRRAAGAPELDAKTAELRRALAAVGALATGELGAAAARRVSLLASNVLQLDPSATPLQQVAAVLDSTARAIDERRDADARRLLETSAAAIAAAVRQGLAAAPVPTHTLESRRLRGALTDELSRAGARR